MLGRALRLVCLVPALLVTSSVTGSGCGGDPTGPKCRKGCPCGASCIDCSKTCHKFAARSELWYWGGAPVPDSLAPR